MPIKSNWKRGQRINADWLNDVARLYNCLERIRGDGFIGINQTGAGTTIRLMLGTLLPRIPKSMKFKVSQNDQVPGYHEAKVVSGTTVAGTALGVTLATADDGANETRSGTVSAAEIQAEAATQTGIVLTGEGCYNITEDSIRYPGGQLIDWRGRLLRVSIAYLDDTEANADDSDAWTVVAPFNFRCGDDANGANVGGRVNSISVHTLAAGGGTVYLLLNGAAPGYAVVMSIGINDPEHLQYHVRIDAGAQYDAASNDDMDGGL